MRAFGEVLWVKNEALKGFGIIAFMVGYSSEVWIVKWSIIFEAIRLEGTTLEINTCT